MKRLDLRSIARALQAAAVLLAAPLVATGDDDPSDWSQLTGDWGGLRTELAAEGWGFFAQYVAGTYANTYGGYDTGARYDGFAQLGVNADLEEIAHWNGMRFQIRWVSYHGGRPSKDLVGQFSGQNLTGWEADDSFVRFYTIYVEKAWLDDRLRVKLGQLAADDDFMLTEVGSVFLNAGFGDVASIGRNLSIPIYPVAAPGVVVEAEPGGPWTLRAGAFTGDSGSDETSNFGFEWGFDAKGGAAFAAEIGAAMPVAGRATTLVLGGIGSTSEIRHPSDDVDRGTCGLYVSMDHDLVVDAAGRPSVAGFARLGWGPRNGQTLERWRVDAGLVRYAPFGRRNDRVGLAVGFRRFAGDYVKEQKSVGNRVERDETVIELTYRAQVTGWLALQPDAQLVLDPHFSRDDAFAVGVYAVIDF